jgi:hypothetical protein
VHPGALRKNFRREIAAELLEVARALVAAERKQVAESGAAAAVEGRSTRRSTRRQRRCYLTSAAARSRRSSRSTSLSSPRRIIERVVAEIDAVVMSVRFTGWQTSREGDRKVKVAIRQALKKFGIDPTGEIFDRAYAYVAEHY